MTRTVLLALAALTSASAFSQGAGTYPERPIRFIVPYGAGGSSDTSARLVAQKLSERLKQQVIVDNRPGANGLIGVAEFMKSRPDGYTLLVADISVVALNPNLLSKPPYDVDKNFEPIIKIATTPNILVANAANGPRTAQAFLDFARANPGKASYGYGATTTQLSGELLKETFRLDLLAVPYKGGPAVVQGLLSGDVMATIDAVAPNQAHIEAGRLIALANMSDVQIPSLPNLPRLADMPGGAGFSTYGWQGLFALKSTPPAVIHFMNAEVARVIALPEIKDKLANLGIIVAATTSPAQFRSFIEAETKKWQAVIEKSGIPKIQ